MKWCAPTSRLCSPGVAPVLALAVALVLTLPKTARAEIDASLSQQLSKEGPIAPGEFFDLTLRVEHPPGATVAVPQSFEPPRWEPIDSSQKTLDEEGKATTVAVIRFGIFRPGETTLKPFEVVVTANGEERVLETQPVTMKVVSALPDEPEPQFTAARPPVPVWVDDYTLAWLGGGAGVLGLLGLIAFAAARRRALMPGPPPPPREPWEVALEKLSALAGDDLVERGEYMVFWVKLSEAIREYLGRTYGFPPTELTTAEILRELNAVKWPAGLDIDDVASFLRHCDRVKFGGLRPTVDESSETLRRGFTIVELTRPRVAPPGENETQQAPEAPGGAAHSGESSDSVAAVVDRGPSRWAPPSEQPRVGSRDEEEE